MREHNLVGVVTIVSHARSLVGGKTMAENILGLVLLLIYRSSKYCVVKIFSDSLACAKIKHVKIHVQY